MMLVIAVAAVSVMGHTHIGMGKHRERVEGGDLGGEGRIRRQGAPGIAAAVDGLGKQAPGAVVRGRDDHVVGLGGAEAELVHGHRLDGLAIRGHHGHRQARDAHVEKCHGRGIDEPQAHLFAPLEQSGPALGRGLAVHQEGVGVAGDVGDVPVAHPHPVPHRPLAPGSGRALVADIPPQISGGAGIDVVVVTGFFQGGEYLRRIVITPVRQHHDIVPVRRVGIGFPGVDDDGAVQPGLLLKAGVAVVPVGAALPDVESILEGFARPDARETQAGHAVHRGRQNQPVPVDRGVFRQPVGDPQGDPLALPPAQDRCRQRAIDTGGKTFLAGEVDPLVIDAQVETVAAQHQWRGIWDTGRPEHARGQRQGGHAADKTAAADHRSASPVRWRGEH